MDYRDYNDNEILSYIYENNEEANEILYKKYEPLITSIATRLFKYCKATGLELNDLIQEGMIALNNAINHYDESKDILFLWYQRIATHFMFSASKPFETRPNRAAFRICVSNRYLCCLILCFLDFLSGMHTKYYNI